MKSYYSIGENIGFWLRDVWGIAFEIFSVLISLCIALALIAAIVALGIVSWGWFR